MAHHPAKRERVAIVVDSAASLPTDIAQQSLLWTVPLNLTMGSRSYLDGVSVSPTEFYRMLRDSADLPTTAAPTPASYLQAFREAAHWAGSILCLTVASKFSASFDSATAAVHLAKDAIPDVAITLLDSGTAAGGEGLVALEALRTASQGGDLDGVVGAAHKVVERVTVIAFLDTLYYLWKGGRVPRIAHVATSALRIKPIFELSQGEVRTIARPRTRSRAMARLVGLMRERVAGRHGINAIVMHADAEAAANDVRRRIELDIDCEQLSVSEFTPVLGAHIGPGLVGIAFWTR